MTRELLPEPVPPIIPIVSPSFAVKDIPVSESSDALPYRKATFSNATLGTPCPAAFCASGEAESVIEGFVSNTTLIRFAHAIDFVILVDQCNNFTL